MRIRMLYDATGNRADIRNDSEIYGSVPASSAARRPPGPFTERPGGRPGGHRERLSDGSANGMEVEDESGGVQMQNE